MRAPVATAGRTPSASRSPCPAAWNGRFYMQGGGGLNGSLGEPLGTQASGATPALARGFAVVSTDSGHRGSNGFDSTFFEDQEATLNFLYQAVGKVTVVAKEIVTKYYGRARRALITWGAPPADARR